MAKVDASVIAFSLTLRGGENIRNLVSESPAAHLAGLHSNPARFLKQVSRAKPDLAFLEYDPTRRDVTGLVSEIRRVAPGVSVVAISEGRDPEDIQASMRLGVKEYLFSPSSVAEFNEAVLRLYRQMSSREGRPTGKIVAVTGAKGGLGASSLTLSLGWGLMKYEAQKVAILDMDFSNGDLSTLADLSPQNTFGNLVKDFDQLDQVMFRTMMTEITPGLSLLASPANYVEAESVQEKHLSRALDFLCAEFPLVLVDLPVGVHELALTVLDRADRILLVLEPTVVVLNRAKRFIEFCSRLGHGHEKVIPVINRWDSRGGVSKRDIKRIMQGMETFKLPNDTRSVLSSANAGNPVISEYPRCRWSKRVKLMGEALRNSLSEDSADKAGRVVKMRKPEERAA